MLRGKAWKWGAKSRERRGRRGREEERERGRNEVNSGPRLSDGEGETRDDTSVPFWQVWDEYLLAFTWPN